MVTFAVTTLEKTITQMADPAKHAALVGLKEGLGKRNFDMVKLMEEIPHADLLFQDLEAMGMNIE